MLKYLSKFKYNLQLKISATIFLVLSNHEIAYPINKIEGLVCANNNDKKILFKLIQAFPENRFYKMRLLN